MTTVAFENDNIFFYKQTIIIMKQTEKNAKRNHLMSSNILKDIFSRFEIVCRFGFVG